MVELADFAVHTLECDAPSAGRARRILAAAVDGAGCDAGIDTALLLVSELVSNAVKYGEGPIALDVTCTDASLVVGVSDAGRDLPHIPRSAAPVPDVKATDPSVPAGDVPPADPDLDVPTGGRGIWLVAALADRWGVQLRRPGKRVWFALGSARARP